MCDICPSGIAAQTLPAIEASGVPILGKYGLAPGKETGKGQGEEVKESAKEAVVGGMPWNTANQIGSSRNTKMHFW
jgi:hypothetical protein